MAATRERLGWTAAPFEIPDDIRQGWDARAKGARAEQAWQQRFEEYRAAHPELAAEFERRMRGELPADWRAAVDAFIADAAAKAAAIATRSASQQVLHVLGAAMPELLGGSADLTGSNNTNHKASQPVGAPGGGNYLHYGVREFGMSAIMNGMALHGGFVPYGGTFLVFSDYARNAVRMAALMKPARRPRVHARFDRSRRGRPDAPARRARREPAPDPEHARLASVRHRRNGAGVGRRPHACEWPDQPDPDPPGLAGHAAHGAAGGRHRARRLRARRLRQACRSAC